MVETTRPHLNDESDNPPSDHACGTEPQRAPARARGQIAALIRAYEREIVFTGSGAVRGAVLATGTQRPHVITQVTQHLLTAAVTTPAPHPA